MRMLKEHLVFPGITYTLFMIDRDKYGQNIQEEIMDNKQK